MTNKMLVVHPDTAVVRQHYLGTSTYACQGENLSGSLKVGRFFEPRSSVQVQKPGALGNVGGQGAVTAYSCR